MSKKDESIKTAVAIKYEVEKDKIPKIIASGKGLIAEKIIEKAREYDVDIFEEPALANELGKLEIGTEIPPQLYEIIAEILYFVHCLNEKWKQKVLKKSNIHLK